MTSLTVGIDGTALFRSRPTGVDRYARDLVAALGRQRPAWDLVVGRWRTLSPTPYDPVDQGRVQVRSATVPRYAARLAELARLDVPFDLATGVRADAWLFPDFVALPLRHPRPSVTVVHDLSFRIAESSGLWMHRSFLNRQVRRATTTSTIVAVSRFVRDQLVAAYGLSSDVPVVSPGVDLAVFRPPPLALREEARRVLGMDRPYILAVGALQPRKNLVRLVQAYSGLGDLAAEHDLVLAGPAGRGATQELAAIKSYAGPGRVRWVGFVPDRLLPALYAEAELTVEPSVYEGFGMPVLEALACGSPVLAASGSGIADAGGEVADYVDPRDVPALCAALRTSLQQLGRQQERREAGVDWAGQHGWDTRGRQVAEVFEHIGIRG